MHQPVYIIILAGIDFLVWCIVYRLIGGYTFHQRTAVEARWSKENPHLPCPNIHEVKEDVNEEVEESEEHNLRNADINPCREHKASIPSSKKRKSFFADP